MKITIEWHVDDVKSLNENLTNEQCIAVLEQAKKTHDASIGINWDVIKCHVQMLYPDIDV